MTILSKSRGGNRTDCVVTALSRLFSPGVFRELAKLGHSPIGAGVVRESGLFPKVEQSLRAYLGEAFRIVSEEMRSEYVFKNAIAEQILLKKHSLRSAAMLTEFRVGSNKADAVVINGTSTVYEIKSERDSLGRLESQLDAYLRVFDKVVVAADECHRRELLDLLPRDVGLVILPKAPPASFTSVREPRSDWNRLEPALMFESLQRTEYLSILSDVAGWESSEIPNGIIHGLARLEFAKLPVPVAHENFVRMLRKRADHQTDASFIRRVPKALKGLAVSISLPPHEQQRVLDALWQPAGLALA
jgi:hypothetical protein